LSRSNTARTALLLFSVSALVASFARADVMNATWLGGAGSWNDPTKWSGGVVPNNNATQSFNAFVPTGSPSINGLSLSIYGLHVDSLGTVNFATGSLAISNEIFVDGVVRCPNARLFAGAPVSGVGTVVVGSNLSGSLFLGVGGLVIENGITIQALSTASIGIIDQPLTNRGLIRGGYQDTWYLPRLSWSTLDNSAGTFQAENGAIAIGKGRAFTLADLGNLKWGPGGTFLIDGTLINDGQTLIADANQGWGILGGTLQGGTLQVDNGTTFRVSDAFNNGTFDGVFIKGTVTDVSKLIIKDGLVRGTGTIALAASPDTNGALLSGTSTLTISSGITVANTPGVDGFTVQNARIDAGTVALTNHGTIRASYLGTSSFVSVSASSFHNDGAIVVDARTSLLVDSSLTFDAGGELRTSVGPHLILLSFAPLDISGALNLSTPDDHLLLSAGVGMQLNTFYRLAIADGGIVGQFDSVTPGFEVEYRNGTEIWARFVPEPAIAMVLLPLAALVRRRRRP
jgi:hypothetical protein